MFKVVHLVRRKPHLTHAQFRDHFERSHAPMAMKFCGHLFLAYRRNYVDHAYHGGDPRVAGGGFGRSEWHWDLMSEWILPDEASFLEIQRIMESPDIRPLFEEDEDRFIDRSTIAMVPCAVADTGVAPPDAARWAETVALWREVDTHGHA
jgi:hypothetical protein